MKLAERENLQRSTYTETGHVGSWNKRANQRRRGRHVVEPGAVLGKSGGPGVGPAKWGAAQCPPAGAGAALVFETQSRGKNLQLGVCARRRKRETPTRAPPWRQRHTSMVHFPLRATEISGSMRAPKELAAEGPAWPAWVWGRARGGRSVGVCIWGVGGAKKAGRSAPVSSRRWHVEA